MIRPANRIPKTKDLETEIQEGKGRLDNAIAQFQGQHSQAESTRTTQFAELQSKRADAFQEQLSELAEREREFRETQQEHFDEEIEKLKETLMERELHFTGEAQKIISGLYASKDQAETLVGVVVNTSFAGGYKKEADAAKSSAWWWRLGATASILALVAFAAWSFDTLGDGIVWTKFGARISVLLALGILAAWCARQAEEFKAVERQARRLQLEFAALTPFLADLTDAIQHKLKEQLTERMFGRRDESKETKSPRFRGSITDVVRELTKTISKLVDKVP